MSSNMVLMESLIEQISMGPFGSDIKVENFKSEGIPVLNGSNIDGIKLSELFSNYVTKEKADSLKKANAKRGDIVITHRGTLGQIAYIPENSSLDRYVISQSQFRVSLNRKLVDPAYFAYYFHTAEGQQRLLSFKSHVGVPALAQATTNFRQLLFPLKPLSEQLEISNLLQNIDLKIELNNKINTELEAMAKLIYDYWFVQFDFPDANGKPYKSSGGKMVYNEELKREIPDGWGAGNIMNLTNLLGGGTPKTTIDKYWSGSIPFFTPADAESNVFSLGTKESITVEGLQSCSSRLYSKGTIFITARGTVGKINIASCDMAMSQSCYALQGKNGVSSEFVYFYVDELVHYIKSKASGSIFKALVTNDFKFTAMTIPPTALINKFTKVSGPIFEKLLINKVENNNLIELRDWLLPMLMNGQVTITTSEAT